MKKIILLGVIFLLSSCSSSNLIIKKESGEKYIIDKSLIKSQEFNINNLIETIRKKENIRIDNIVKELNESKEIEAQLKRNKALRESLSVSQKLIDNNCGQWYRPELCNKGINNLDDNKDLLAKGEKMIENLRVKNKLFIKNEKDKVRNYINELFNNNYSSRHLVKVIYSSKYFDTNKNQLIIPAKSINCFNPVLQEIFYEAWKKYGKIENDELNYIDKMVCEKYSKFNEN